MISGSRLRIFADDLPERPELESRDEAQIARHLGEVGIRFERWCAAAPLAAGASPETILAAYARETERLQAEGGYRTVDVVSMDASHPEKTALREKFLAEHTHAEDEVRFFVDGGGLFTLHVGDRVFEALCVRNDLIRVPAKTRHWFDMGSAPHFVAIRLFRDPSGWIADYTGSDIATRFPRLDPADLPS